MDGVRDGQEAAVVEAVGEEVVEHAAVLAAEHASTGRRRSAIFVTSLREDALEELLGVGPLRLDLAHVGDVEEAGARADGHVLLADALVLDRHLPARERDELGAGRRVAVVERGAAEGVGGDRHGRVELSTGSGPRTGGRPGVFIAPAALTECAAWPIEVVMRRLRSISLLARVGLISLALFVALGLALGKVLGDMIERRAHDNTVATAKAIADLGIRHYFREGELDVRPSPARVRLLDDRLLADDLRGAGIERVKVFNSQPRIVYSDDHAKIWEDARGAPNVRRALGGETVANVSPGVDDSGRGHRTFSVYTPVRVGDSERPNAVFELYIPYGPIAAQIAHDTRIVHAGLASGCCSSTWSCSRWSGGRRGRSASSWPTTATAPPTTRSRAWPTAFSSQAWGPACWPRGAGPP